MVWVTTFGAFMGWIGHHVGRDGDGEQAPFLQGFKPK